ncbi:hypothetical protein VN24_10450 [Paenibacillus beijingensis]|uniref:Uncharacterized protein n=1 Tax=Paenibacillus beijingensis TaxID=1126833 RepID=A0A0D5NI27_9BACL|nr:hypothetical protein VN24_10450 [Paenibacillus beijingensis]
MGKQASTPRRKSSSRRGSLFVWAGRLEGDAVDCRHACHTARLKLRAVRNGGKLANSAAIVCSFLVKKESGAD